MFSITLSWGLTFFFYVQLWPLLMELAFYQFSNNLKIFGYLIFYFSSLHFNVFPHKMFFLPFPAVLLQLTTSCLIEVADIRHFYFVLVFWNSLFLLLILPFNFLLGLCYFFLTHETNLGQRQSWHRERTTVDKQMFNNMCHLNDSHCFLTFSPT